MFKNAPSAKDTSAVGLTVTGTSQTDLILQLVCIKQNVPGPEVSLFVLVDLWHCEMNLAGQ